MADFADELALQIPRLRRYARALTHDVSWADDLVQDTLERALQRRWLFRINSNLTAWLFTMLYRLYLNEAPRRQIAAVSLEDVPEPATPGDLGQQLDLQRALARLSPEHRAVIVLVGLEQMRYQEVADVLNVPLGTVMSRLARARSHLRELLSGQSAHAASAHLTRVK
ncbi:sigma-70 family RNA polymerase sigma factor [Noviherbaspirillum sp.]|jgi:RNA polymerase sigma-70 factor (ECF subfamily)|uniref:sigma-70 family RNA polymerase sigma factor n=1 Tax=Noviherbaspirillum sp. TaxID=1926288 RepID=UPI0025D5A76F|nr:sigma-70 family RNA polymerase sigma factor [Noviherbaspirillum sp.]